MNEDTFEETERWVTDTLLDLVNKGLVVLAHDEKGHAFFVARFDLDEWSG